MSPWVKLDDNAMDHPKILALTDGAFRLWMRSLSYCRRNLTDGFVSHLALKTFRESKEARIRELTTPPDTGVVPLWEIADGGYQMHDYLQWNDSREQVEGLREHAKERMARLRGSSRGVRANSARSSQGVRDTNPTQPETNPTQPEREKTRALDSKPDDSTLPKRAGEFCKWYEDAHDQVIGIGYIGTRKDYESALRLVAKFTDQQIRDAAQVWFGMEDDFATNGTRTVPKFASRITRCLELMKQKGVA